MSSIDIADIARDNDPSRLWLQIYFFKDRGVTKELVARAEAMGFEAIVLTVGCPVPGLRDRNLRNRFRLPPDIGAAHFPREGKANFNNPIHQFERAEIDAAATWKDIAWLRGLTGLPIIAKGILNRVDVVNVVECGLEALMVSNHGGRQLDTSVSSVSALPSIVREADGRVRVFIDSGFRRGTDVLKALALGADAVFLGRPILWALAVGGAEGVQAMIECLMRELENALQLSGCRNIAELREASDRILVWR